MHIMRKRKNLYIRHDNTMIFVINMYFSEC